jgi:hypothetical protein
MEECWATASFIYMEIIIRPITLWDQLHQDNEWESHILLCFIDVSVPGEHQRYG